jgi:hypothetical protein
MSTLTTRAGKGSPLTNQELDDNFSNLNTDKLELRVTSVASSATPTPAAITTLYTLTALAEAATFAAPSGSPIAGHKILIRIKDNGSPRALGWNAIYRAVGVTLPTTTVANKTTYVGIMYNSTDVKWDVTAVATEA